MGKSYVTRCWNLWTTGKIDYSDDNAGYIGHLVETLYVPPDLEWAHTAKEFRGVGYSPVRHESTQEAADRILALPESERLIAIKLAWQDVYVTTLLTSRSLVSAYAAMLNRACELRALDDRLVLNPLPIMPAKTITYSTPSFTAGV